MSSQMGIDHYFKSTSGKKSTIDSLKKQPTNALNRSKTGYKVSKNGSGRSREFRSSSFATQIDDKKLQEIARSSLSETSTENEIFEESICKQNKVGTTTPLKKTIRGFVMACNSPPAKRTPEKISLKRRNRDSPGMSYPPKKSPKSHQNIADLAKSQSPDITDFSKLSASGASLISCEIIDSDIIEVTDENNFDEEIKKGDNSTECQESEGNIERENTADDNQCNSNKNETKFTPKKRKIRDSSSSRNSPSTSGWKVRVSIKTPERLMTALSSDWQKTLEASQELASLNCPEIVSKENLQSLPDNEENNENLSEKFTSPRRNDDNVHKSSPRRALFLPQNAAKKVTFQRNECDAIPLTNSIENAVVTLREETKMSPQGILKSTNLWTNGNSNERINEGQHLPEKVGTSQIISVNNERMNLSTEVGEIVNLPRNSVGAPNSSTKIVEASNSPTKFSEVSNMPTKIANPPKTPTKLNGASSFPTKMTNPPKTPTKFNEASYSSQKMTDSSKSPSKINELLKTPIKSPSKSSKSTFSPRIKCSLQKVYKERVDTNLATKAVENLNQAKQGIIPMNNFDLELVYQNKSFDFVYGSLNANTAIKYEVKDVQVPEDKHADHFFMVLVNVFSEPLNCGYFDEQELDTVFSIFTLSPGAQSLLVRMLKRKRGWHRVSNIKYPEIANDLKPVFKELVDHGFLDDDITNEDSFKLLSLLQADEVKAVCQAMNVKRSAKKKTLISDLVAKLAKNKKPLFRGMKSPSTALIEKVTSVLGPCICLPDRIENLLNRIFILLLPSQDPKENMAEAFRMLIQVHYGDKIFPKTPKERFPIFRNRLHLIRYAEARSAWYQIINASESKDWDTVRTLGQLAYDNLKPYFESYGDETESSIIPSHVKRFDANYVWVKVMSASVEGFKRAKAMAQAAEFLHTLVSPSNKIPGNRTRWYNELAMIESYHRKNFEISAEITIAALMQERLSEIDAAEIFERARKLVKSKSVSADTKERINAAVCLKQEMFISTSEPTIKEITANMVEGNTTGSKSLWSMNIGGADTGYLTVENVARRHYLGEGFPSGVHCEGALPVTIFATVLWDEIYTVFVPGAFVSSYQDAPLDLYTSHFLESRRERVEEKLKLIRRLDLKYLSNMMHEDFLKYCAYTSLMHAHLFPNADDFKDFIECLGIDAVVGICERLAGNYNQWKSGFPDLAVWNPVTKKCKIVEVKGPGDSLSTKQKLWIQFLECLGVDVEVCVVKGTTKRYAT